MHIHWLFVCSYVCLFVVLSPAGNLLHHYSQVYNGSGALLTAPMCPRYIWVKPKPLNESEPRCVHQCVVYVSPCVVCVVFLSPCVWCVFLPVWCVSLPVCGGCFSLCGMCLSPCVWWVSLSLCGVCVSLCLSLCAFLSSPCCNVSGQGVI